MRRLPEMFAIFKSFMSIKTQMLPKCIQKIAPSMLKDVLSKDALKMVDRSKRKLLRRLSEGDKRVTMILPDN